MSRLRRAASHLLASIALLAAIGQGAGVHAHALTEVDLAPHAVMTVDAGLEGCGVQTHLEAATPHRHAACGSCALASTPSHGAPAVAVAAAPGTAGEAGFGTPSRWGASTPFASGPARAPPSC